MRSTFLILFCFLASVAQATSTVTTASAVTLRLRSGFVVSTNGSDANPGNSAMPLATLSQAQALVRGVRVLGSNIITVTLATNIPATNGTLRFTAADSGVNGGLIIWQGSQLDGANYVNGWNAVSNGIFSASYSGQNMRALYVNGTRYYRATGTNVPSTNHYTATGWNTNLLNGTRNPANIEFTFNTYVWSQSRDIVMLAGSTITCLNPCHTNIHAWPGMPTNRVNVWTDFVSQTNRGTFYYDEANATLFVMPLTNHTLASSIVAVPSGNSTFATFTNTGNLIWGIGSKHAGYDLRTDGFASIAQCYLSTLAHQQTNFNDLNYDSPPAALLFSGVTNLVVTNGVHEHHDAAAIRMQDISTNSAIIGNVVRDIGANGIVIGDALEYANVAVSDGIRVQQNLIRDTGADFKGAVALQLPFVTRAVVPNNYIDGVPAYGIAIGIGLSAGSNYNTKLGTNLYLFNFITNSSYAMRDAAGIYAQNLNHGSLMASNVILRVPSGPVWDLGGGTADGNAAIYLDEGSGGWGLHHNVSTNVTFVFAFNQPVSTNVVGVNYSVTTNTYVGVALPSTYTVPTVQADPISSNPGIVSAAGLTGSFTNLFNR